NCWWNNWLRPYDLFNCRIVINPLDPGSLVISGRLTLSIFSLLRNSIDEEEGFRYCPLTSKSIVAINKFFNFWIRLSIYLRRLPIYRPGPDKLFYSYAQFWSFFLPNTS